MGDGEGGQPLAQGEYEYLCDGVPVPVSERWAVLRAGEKFVVRSVREIPALSVVISARALVASGRIQRCLLRWCDAGQQQAIAVAGYRAAEEGNRCGIYRVRRAGAATRGVAVDAALYFPLLRIFAGQLLGVLAAQENAEAQVLVPWIHDPAQTGKLFEPEVSQRRVRFLQAVEVAGSGERLDSFEYSGGRYDNGAVYQLVQGLLREYRWRQGSSEWTVRLKNLQGRWPGEELWPHAIAPASPVGRIEA